jgi:hypothetical protein
MENVPNVEIVRDPSPRLRMTTLKKIRLNGAGTAAVSVFVKFDKNQPLPVRSLT